MKLNDKLYNVLKWVVITFLPALSTLIAGAAILYKFDATVIIGTIGLATTFIGTLIGISSVNYAKQKNEE